MSAARDATSALSPQHIDLLRQRAIPIEVALLAGLRSVSSEQANELLGTNGFAGAGLAIPYLGITPPYWRIRVDSGPIRYLVPAKREVPIYTPPSIIDAPDLGEMSSKLVVVEAPLKALALASIGVRAVGLGGVATTLDKNGRLNASWDRLDLDVRNVIVGFDANRRIKHAVAVAEARIVMALQNAGATVCVADLPRGPRGQEGWGPDDFLAKNGAGALLKWIADAVPGDPLDRLAALVDAADVEKAEALLADGPFLASLLERGPHVLAGVRRRLADVGIRKGDLDAAINAHKKSRHGHDEERERDKPDSPYVIDQGHFACVEAKHPFAICNFTAQIIEDVTLDDGAEVSREFTIEGTTDSSVKLAPIRVPAEKFKSSSSVWTAAWGSRAIVHADCQQHVHVAIEYNSPNTKRSTVYQHIGWRMVDGSLVYLSASGAVGAVVNASVRLDSTLTRYALPTKSTTYVEDTRKALRASLRVLDVAPDTLTIPGLAATYRAVLCHWLACDFVVWVHGPTGRLKSTFVALLLAHFGADFDRERLTANWHDTITALETKMFRAADTIVVIDDFAPRGAEDQNDLRRKAAQIVRNIGNGSSRSRMKSDLTARADRPPRCLCVSTGEDMPSGESIIARTLPLAMPNVRLDIVNECQSHVHLLPVAMRAYVEAVARWAASPDFGSNLRRRFEDLRSSFAKGGHLRAPAAAAHLMLGWLAFLRFAEDVGAIDSAKAEELRSRGDAALRAQLDLQAVTASNETPVRRFLETLQSLLDGGKVRLASTDQEITPLPGSDTLGWQADDGKIHLLPELAYGAVAKAMRENGRGLPIKDSTLWDRLVALGYATPFEAGRIGVQRKHAGRRPRVIELLPQALGDGPADDPPPDGGVPQDSAPTDPPSGAWQVAVPLDESTPCPGCPAPAGGIGLPERGSEQEIAGPSFSQPPPLVDASTPHGTGATGARREEIDEKSLRQCVLPVPHPRPEPWGTTGDRGARLGHEVVQDAARLPELARAVEVAGVVGLDCETTGLDPLVHCPRLLQLALPDGRVYVVDLFATSGAGPLAEALACVEVIGHNIGFDLGFLRRHFGIAPRAAWDSMLAAQLIDGGINLHAKGYFKLDAVTDRLIGVRLDKSLQTSDWSGELSDGQIRYAAGDVEHLFPLRVALEKRLAERRLETVMGIECDVLPAIVGMELAGVPVDVAALDALAELRMRESIEARERVCAALRIDNPNSPKQLLPALRAVGLDVNETNAEALAPFRDRAIVRDLATMRTAKKTADDARALAEVARSQADGRVRPSWWQIGAPTGRMATSDPNLLGLPKKDRSLRPCIVAPPERRFIVADYSAIELRTLAQGTGDKRLSDIFGAKGDPHRELAAVLARKAAADVTNEERGRAKPVNFGFAFGMGPDRFCSYALKDYGVSFAPDEARRFKAAYLATYRQVDEWQRVTRAQMDPEARTLSGRVRDFPDQRNGYTERLNMPVQGTAADGLKRAMALLAPRLAKLDAQILLAVHDELVVEAPEHVAEEVKRVVVDGMEEGMAVDVSVPIVVESDVRRTWGGP